MQVLVRPCASPPVVMPAREGPCIPLAVRVPALVRPYSRDRRFRPGSGQLRPSSWRRRSWGGRGSESRWRRGP
eukprot:8596940-Alexandrium_andersonii.AAC.1